MLSFNKLYWIVYGGKRNDMTEYVYIFAIERIPAFADDVYRQYCMCDINKLS